MSLGVLEQTVEWVVIFAKALLDWDHCFGEELEFELEHSVEHQQTEYGQNDCGF
jgi:hypothetical protein